MQVSNCIKKKSHSVIDFLHCYMMQQKQKETQIKENAYLHEVQ